MEELLFQYNPWWEEDYSQKNIIDRPLYTGHLKRQIETKYIVFLTGIRRVGKTTLMKILITHLLKTGVEGRNILYVSLDDYLLLHKNIFDVLEEYRKIHKLKIEEKIFIFLDEITYQENFHQQLKTLYDRENIKIFATSSSSSLLKDKKAFLTGRSVIQEINPLDFTEYKSFRKIEIKKRDKILNESYFKEYIKAGGLPENVIKPDREYLKNLVDDIIQKDITAFHGIRNHQLIKDYYTLLVERSGKQMSINKIANILKISPDSAKRYLYYFEETYLIHLLPRWGKTNEKLLSPRKIYICDLGVKYLFMGGRDIGSYLENYIYLKLRNNRRDLYYVYENGIEIDFFTSDKILIESKFNADLTSRQQELFRRFPSNKKIIIDSVGKLGILDEL